MPLPVGAVQESSIDAASNKDLDDGPIWRQNSPGRATTTELVLGACLASEQRRGRTVGGGAGRAGLDRRPLALTVRRVRRAEVAAGVVRARLGLGRAGRRCGRPEEPQALRRPALSVQPSFSSNAQGRWGMLFEGSESTSPRPWGGAGAYVVGRVAEEVAGVGAGAGGAEAVDVQVAQRLA